jgi:bacteriocin-like protein
MASIRISDLSVDSESFLDELSESDLASINGGLDRDMNHLWKR